MASIADVAETDPTNMRTRREAEVLNCIEALRPKMIETLRTLVSFPTMNPPGENEHEAQEWMASRLSSLGLNVEVFDAIPGRPNVVGRLPGVGDGRSCLFNGHIDVAELEPESWTYPPFEGVVEDGLMYGLGTSDMKSAHAGFLIALEAVQMTGHLNGDVTYECVTGEEAGEPGTRSCIDRGIRADFAINGEPSAAAAIVVTSVGIFNGCITVGYAGTDHLTTRLRFTRTGGGMIGANCIEKMATKIVPGLLELEGMWGLLKTHPQLPAGATLINVLAIEGGGNTFMLPNECRLYITVGYLANEDRAEVKREVERHIAAIAAADPWLREHPPRVDWDPARLAIDFRPLVGSPTDPGACLLAECVHDATGITPVVSGREAIVDGGWLHEAGIPTVVFGPGTREVIHAADEYVELDNVERFAKSTALFLLRWCGEAA